MQSGLLAAALFQPGSGGFDPRGTVRSNVENYHTWQHFNNGKGGGGNGGGGSGGITGGIFIALIVIYILYEIFF